MGSETEYEVVLCPKGTTPHTATETRKFTYESEEDDDDALRSEVIEHIISERIDPNSFRRHWTLYSITPADEANVGYGRIANSFDDF